LLVIENHLAFPILPHFSYYYKNDFI
jgi:hypothetical protein